MRTVPDRPRRRLALALLCYAIVGIATQYELVRAGLGAATWRQQMLGQDCLLHAWAIAWDQHALVTAPARIADANIFHPERGTLLYSDHLLGPALVSAPLRLFTDHPLLVHNLVAVAAPVLDAVALFALAFDLTRSVPGAFVGGLVFGFAPLRLATDACQVQMTAAWWLPLVLLGGLRAVRGEGRRWAAVAGLALLGEGLTSVYVTAFFLPFLGLAHVVWLRRYPWRASRGGWPALVAAEAAAGLVLAPTALAYRAVQADLGIERSPFLNAILSLQPGALGDLVPSITLGAMTFLVIARGRDLPRRFREARGLVLAVLAGALVLALGPAITLPGDRGTIAGPYRLLVELPGFTALRVPGRMVHVALVAASLVAAGGVVVVREVAWRAPAAATLAVVAALAWEGRPPRVGTQPVPRPERVHRVYPWLATLPETTRIVEIPIDPFAGLTTLRQYASTVHWLPSLNGNTGIQPPVHAYMVKQLARFPSTDVVDDLARLGVTHVVVHTDLLDPAARAAVDRAAQGGVLHPVWSLDGVDVYAIAPGRGGPTSLPTGKPVPRDGWTVVATVAPASATFAIDTDPETAWHSWAELDASVQRGWRHPVPVLGRWEAFLAAAPATLEIDLGTTVPLARIDVRLGGSDPMVVQATSIEVTEDGGVWLPLRLVAAPDVRGLVDDAAALLLAGLPDGRMRARRVRVRTGALEARVGDVVVYSRE
jgi:hypothetical protein